MTREELIARLIDAENLDTESMHSKQDELLLEYINDPEVTAIFERSVKWYA
jgi:hypothetical protein